MNRNDLRQWRTERDLSLTDMATLLGVHFVTVYRWEAGDRAIPPFLELALRYLQEQPLLYREPLYQEPAVTE